MIAFYETEEITAVLLDGQQDGDDELPSPLYFLLIQLAISEVFSRFGLSILERLSKYGDSRGMITVFWA